MKSAFFHQKKNAKGRNVSADVKGTFKQDQRFKIKQIRRMLSKETVYFKELHNAHGTVKNSIITARNKVVKRLNGRLGKLQHKKIPKSPSFSCF
jgi:hypothetical protein